MNLSLLLILLPFVAALGSVFAPSNQVAVRVALGSTALSFVLSLFLPLSSAIAVPWLPGFGVTFALSPAGAASVLIPVAALVMIPTVYYAAARVTERTAALLALLLAMQAGLNGIFLADDLVIFYLFWEATLIPSILMLGIWGRAGGRRAAVKYLIYAVAGSFVMLVAILALRPLSGALSYQFDDLIAATVTLPAATQLWLFVGLAIGMAVKLPLWPLHSWLPDVNEQNHPSGVADVAGTLYKVGGYGFFAWALPLLPQAAELASPLLMGLAAFTALYAAIVATAQTHLKRFLAFASLAHMGIVGVGIFALHAAGMSGGVYLLAAQMLSTGGLFLISGMLFERRETFDLKAFGGLAKSAPALSALTLFVLLTSIGVPGLANFPGEFMSLLGAYQTNALIAIMATLSVIAAGVYGVNMYQRVYQGEAAVTTTDIRRPEVLTLIPIVLGILWLSLAPSPHLSHIERQATRMFSEPTPLLIEVSRDNPTARSHLEGRD
jgi:NADH-quinone oxidoreductase subunit M